MKADGGPRPPLSVEREIDGGLNSRAPAGPHHRNGEPLPGPGDWGGWVNSGRAPPVLTIGMVSPSPLDGGLNSRACLRILPVQFTYWVGGHRNE